MENKKYGTFLGVYVPTILMIFGVIIFLRLGWIVGHAGIGLSLTIITFAALITLITTLSLSAIATNHEIGKGGIYYILSRSLGLEVGAALGLPLYLKQSLSIAFCCVGFAESLHDLIPAWSITQIGIGTLIVLTALAYKSLNGALKVQVIIFLALIASFISLFMGSEPTPMHEETFIPKAPESIRFWTIFAIFFPAMTGIESSVSLSGDLKNPTKSLPLGTITALLTAYVVYLAIPLFLVKHVSIERLALDPLIMQDMALIPSLIIIGIWGATISSALGGLLGAPRTLQALSDDGIAPGVFKGKPGSEPKLATLATFVLSFFGVYFGSINMIAPLLTMICLICYGVLNFSAGIESLMGNPSWRPRFNIHWSVSFLGGILCFVAMLMIDPGWALVSIGIAFVIYMLAKRKNLISTWDDIRLGIWMFFSRNAVYRLAHEGISKSWRPHFLVFTKKPEPSNHLVKFTQAISQSKGFLTMASFQNEVIVSEKDRRDKEKDIALHLKKNDIHALVKLYQSTNPLIEMQRMIEHYGFGPLSPNTVVFGGLSREDETEEFTRVLISAHQKECNVVIMNDKVALEDAKDIHIWWDDKNPSNGEFMLILAYMLRKNPVWKKTRLCVKGIVANEIARKEKLDYFRDLGIKKRLILDVEIFVSMKPKEEFNDFIKTFSKNAGIVFISMRAPRETETVEAYREYLLSLPFSESEFPPIALSLSSEATPLDDILT